MRNKIISAAALVVGTLMLTSGCSLISGTTEDSSSVAQKVIQSYDFSQMELIQLEEPKEGQQMAVVKTSEGDISLVLYPEYCPNTVANFVARAKEGYYDNTSVFALYTDYYFMAGSKAEDGSEGVTEDGNPIPNECSVNLWPFKGAMLAYNDTVGYGDSRFMIIDEIEITDEELSDMRLKAVDEDGNQVIPDALLEAFVSAGSLPGLSCSYTVFGQMIDGYDTLDKILAISADEDTLRPIKDVTISTVEITEYHAE